MASRINDNVRTEWDNIDFEDDKPIEYNANSPTKEVAKDRDGASKVKDNAKNSGQKARKSPVRKQHKRSDSTQEQTSLTQDCITLEPRASIQSKYSWLSNADPAYPQLPIQDRGQQYRRNISPVKLSNTHGITGAPKGLEKKDPTSKGLAIPTLDETLDHDPSESRDRSSIDESDQETGIDGQKVASTVDETEESSTGEDESDPESPVIATPKGIRLPVDSDDEEFKAAKDKRVRAYASNGQLSNAQKPMYNEEQQKQASISGRQDNPISLVSSGVPSTPTDLGYSQHSSMLPPVQTKSLNNSIAKKEQHIIKGNQIPIPVSSSTEPSQNSRSSKSEDVQVQRTPTQNKTRRDNVSDNHINLISYPSLPSTTPTSISGESRLSLEQKRPLVVLPPSPQKAHTSTSQASASPRKHPRSSLELSRDISSSSRKRQRIDSPHSIIPKGQDSQAAIMSVPPSSDSRRVQATNSGFQHPSPQKSLRSMPSTPGIASTKPPVGYQPTQSTHPISTKSATYIQEQIQSPRKDINFNHALPHTSASQPVPERSRIHQAAQVTMAGLPPQTKTSSAELPRQAATANKEVSEPSKLADHKPAVLDLEPLTKILDMRSADYCVAVRNDRVYSGLQSLFCEFLAIHLTYLGNMEHLFNLCIWLLRSVVNPHRQESIDEEFWDDFILQHQQGKYNEYVQHCLVKFRQPGSWTTWYQQAQKNKLSTNVVTATRLQNILLGRETAIPKRNIPLLWSRFMNVNRGRVQGSH